MNNLINLKQADATFKARVQVIESSTDIPKKDDPTKSLALTVVADELGNVHKFWNDNNRPLGKEEEVIDIIVTTSANRIDGSKNPESDCYSKAVRLQPGFLKTGAIAKEEAVTA